MLEYFKSVIANPVVRRFYRSAGAASAGMTLSIFLQTPWGLVAAPVLMATFKAVRESQKANSLPLKFWMNWF